MKEGKLLCKRDYEKEEEALLNLMSPAASVSGKVE